MMKYVSKISFLIMTALLILGSMQVALAQNPVTVNNGKTKGHLADTIQEKTAQFQEGIRKISESQFAKTIGKGIEAAKKGIKMAKEKYDKVMALKNKVTKVIKDIKNSREYKAAMLAKDIAKETKKLMELKNKYMAKLKEIKEKIKMEKELLSAKSEIAKENYETGLEILKDQGYEISDEGVADLKIAENASSLGLTKEMQAKDFIFNLEKQRKEASEALAEFNLAQDEDEEFVEIDNMASLEAAFSGNKVFTEEDDNQESKQIENIKEQTSTAKRQSEPMAKKATSLEKSISEEEENKVSQENLTLQNRLSSGSEPAKIETDKEFAKKGSDKQTETEEMSVPSTEKDITSQGDRSVDVKEFEKKGQKSKDKTIKAEKKSDSASQSTAHSSRVKFDSASVPETENSFTEGNIRNVSSEVFRTNESAAKQEEKYRFKGIIGSNKELPAEKNKIGDIYKTSKGEGYVWEEMPKTKEMFWIKLPKEIEITSKLDEKTVSKIETAVKEDIRKREQGVSEDETTLTAEEKADD